ncbi:MAG: translation initiation factor [Bacteroidales bacterium]|nr:translation initiation factor [Bacteroidales bacterium]
MTPKKRPKGIVYSTNPEFQYDWNEQGEQKSIPPAEQNLRIHLQSLKGNKKLSIVRGFRGTDADLNELGKTLKSACGVGGSVKDGDILIQGDQREKVLAILIKKGYRAKKSGG